MPPAKKSRATQRYGIRSVQRALALLLTFLHCDGELTATEISKELRLDLSTTFRMLVTLQAQGFVEQDPSTGKYRLGVMCLELGSQFQKNSDVRARALAAMEALRNEFGETVHLTILDGKEVVYLEKLGGLHPIGIMSSRVGNRAPAHCTGVGKALLAFLPEEQVRKQFQRGRLMRFTDRTITEWTVLSDELAKIRESGYAIDNEEHEPGVKCVAVPIFDHQGVAAAMSISGPVERMDMEIDKNKLIERLMRAGAQISSQMGGAHLPNVPALPRAAVSAGA